MRRRERPAAARAVDLPGRLVDRRHVEDWLEPGELAEVDAVVAVGDAEARASALERAEIRANRRWARARLDFAREHGIGPQELRGVLPCWIRWKDETR